jgi:phosphohistidine phosphatase
MRYDSSSRFSDSIAFGAPWYEGAMELYLVRHGDAEREGDDSRRVLSARGVDEVERLGALLRARGARVVEIRHSPKRRAVQTAEILSAALGVPSRETAGMMPDDDPSTLAAELEEESHDLMLVGHLPYLPHLAALLLRAPVPPFQLPTAGLACLRRRAGRWETY